MFDEKEIKKLAQLARITVSESQAKEFRHEIESILSYIAQIKEATTQELLPEEGEHRNIMREDGEPHESGFFSKVLIAAFPQKEREYVKVKKIISQD